MTMDIVQGVKWHAQYRRSISYLGRNIFNLDIQKFIDSIDIDLPRALQLCTRTAILGGTESLRNAEHDFHCPCFWLHGRFFVVISAAIRLAAEQQCHAPDLLSFQCFRKVGRASHYAQAIRSRQ